MIKYAGTIAKSPKVGDKAIFLTLSIDDATIGCVGFFHRLDADFADTLRSLQSGDEFVFMGVEHINKRNGRKEIVIEAPPKETDLKYAIDPEVDFTIGGLSSYNRKEIYWMPKARPEYRSAYTDGDYYWYEGDDIKCPTVF